MITRDELSKLNVLVVGDVMLDQYWDGLVERISPEAPVPIVKIQQIKKKLGGAANVALNVKSLGANVTLLGCVGRDSEGAGLKKLLQENHIDFEFIEHESIETIVKLRVSSRNHQMIRVDFEKDIPDIVGQELRRKYHRLVSRTNVVVISDYGKGTVTHPKEYIQLAIKNGVNVLVDPKGNDLSKYANANIITPNRSELAAMIGKWSDEQDLTCRVSKARELFEVGSILLTRSEQGMTLFDGDGAENVNAVCHEVADVTGAGDTVIATMAVLVAAGISTKLAMQYANVAAGAVVRKFGTATAKYEEVFSNENIR
jgi:rfaE bifunctional protein kinase chain/domain